MTKRVPVECPGCGRKMGVSKPTKMVSGAGYEVRMFCPCGWIGPYGLGETEEESIDKAFEVAAKRYIPTFTTTLEE